MDDIDVADRPSSGPHGSPVPTRRTKRHWLARGEHHQCRSGGRDDRHERVHVAVLFVAAAAALLWSLVPEAVAQEVRGALAGDGRERRTITPPLFDAWAAYRTLVGNHQRRNGHGKSEKSGSGSGPLSTAARVAPSRVSQR